MNLLEVIAQMRAERQLLDESILALERLAASAAAKRRGRPPAWLAKVQATAEPEPKPKKRRLSAAGRARIAEAARNRWAAARVKKDKE
ncbi:MAG: hypothetical protein ACKV22_14380 [Bryobacteraceae bacterium]